MITWKIKLNFFFITRYVLPISKVKKYQAFSSFKDWEPASLQIFNEHQTFANITTWYFFTLLMGRTYLVVKKKLSNVYQVIILILAAVGIFFVLQTGYYGGELVNKFGINKEFRTQIENK